MNPMPGEIDPENGVAPLLPVAADDEEQQLGDVDDDDDVGPDALPTDSDSSPQLPGLRIVVNPYSDLELLGVGVTVFAFFYIIPYFLVSLLDVSIRVLKAIYYPLGIGYILVLHQKMDRKDKFRNHWVIKWIDQNDYKCIGYLVLLLCIYSIDHRTHGHFLDGLSNIFGRENQHPFIYYPWNISLMLLVVGFMALSSTSVVFLASRKIFVTFRLARTMQAGRERTVVLAKGGAIVALSALLFALSRKKVQDGEYEGPPFGSFFWGTCEACLFSSSVAALFAGVQFLRAHDWTMPSLTTTPEVRETPE
jgi:hypothetical protein